MHFSRGSARRHVTAPPVLASWLAGRRSRITHDRERRRLLVTVISGAVLVERGIEELLAPWADRVTVTRSDGRRRPERRPDVVIFDLATSTASRWAQARGTAASALVLLDWEGRLPPRDDLEPFGVDGRVDGRVDASLSGPDFLGALLEVVERVSSGTR